MIFFCQFKKKYVLLHSLLTEKSRSLKVNTSGNSSVGRARPCQGRGREFESRFPLKKREVIEICKRK